MKGTAGWVLASLAVLALCAWAAAGWWRSKNVSRVQRGWEVADARGCFTCHGAGGVTGRPDPGVGIGGAPAFSKDDVEAYAKTDDEIREWILDGLPRRIRADAGSSDPADAPLIRMPAWRGVLSAREVDDLVAYIKASADFRASRDARADAGYEAADRLGCFGCHGPQGRGTPPNPRSLKGYIPSWDGPDFAELARGEGEVKEWILDGRPRRLQEQRLARYFMDRQVIQMPAYRGRISPQDLDRIVDYIQWLRVSR